MSEPSAVTENKHGDLHGHADHGHAHHGSFVSHVKVYLFVGGALFAATLLTVWLSYWDFAHYSAFRKIFGYIGVQGHGINIFVGLILATAKVCLVGAWFMHLKDEKSSVWRPLIFTFVFVMGLFLLCLLHYIDPIPTTSHWHH